MPIDVTTPGGLTLALAPDLILMGGAMILMLWAAWRPDSASHQRSVGIGALVLTLITAAAVIWFAASGAKAKEGIVDEAKGKFQKKTGEIKRDVMRD